MLGEILGAIVCIFGMLIIGAIIITMIIKDKD